MRRSLFGSRPVSWIVCAVLAILFISPTIAAKSDNNSRSDKHSKDVVFEEEFPIGKDGNLVVDVEDMDVYLETGTREHATVEVFISGSDREKALEYFENMRFEAQLDGNTLEVNSRDSRQSGWNTWFGTRHPRVLLIVSLPKDINIEIDTEDGDVEIGKIAGNASVRTEDGDVEILEIHGTSVDIRTEDGDLDAEMLHAIDITVKTEDGDIAIGTAKAERFGVYTEDGDVVVSHIESGGTTVETTDGDLDITVTGNQLEISCEDGDIRVTLLAAMEADIEIEDGDVELTLPKDAGFDLDLGGGDVIIRSKLSVEGRVSDRTIRGTVNSGGPLVRVRGNDGSIIVRQK